MSLESPTLMVHQGKGDSSGRERRKEVSEL